MKRFVDFMKTTIIGGIVFLIPLVLIIIVLGKAISLMRQVSMPIASLLRVDTVAGIAAANIIGLIAVLTICFVAGLLARYSLSSKVVQKAEAKFLWHIPGYAFVKSITDSLSTGNTTPALSPILCRFDDCWQVGFEVERLKDERVVVYLPGAPNPWSGSIMLIESGRVEPINSSMMKVVGSLRRLGHDSSQLFNNT